MKTYLRAIFIAIALMLTVAVPMRAQANCWVENVCYFSYGRRICQPQQRCSFPRQRVCSWVNRCAPQRVCSFSFGVQQCYYRDVCQQVQVCN